MLLDFYYSYSTYLYIPAPTPCPPLIVLVQDKDKVIDELEKETEKAKAIREMEERLMASAFYDLGMKLHRGAVEDRLKNLSQGQSFLAKQRQVRGRGIVLG